MKNKLSILIISMFVSSLLITAQANSNAEQPEKQKTITLFDVKNNIDKEKLTIKGTDLTPECKYPWTIQKYNTAAGQQVIEVNNGKLIFQILPSKGMSIQNVTLDNKGPAWNSPSTGNQAASFVEVSVDSKPPYTLTIRGKTNQVPTEEPELVTEISTVPGTSTFQLSNTFDFANIKPKLTVSVKPTQTLADITKSATTWEPSFTEWFGKPAPEFTITDITGKKHKVSDYRGKNIIVNVWATWCPPCRKEIPDFIKLRDEIKEDELAILGISTENGQESKVKDFVKENKMNYTIAVADFSKLEAPYSKVSAIPTTFFVDKEGKIKFATIGVLTLEDAKKILEAK